MALGATSRSGVSGVIICLMHAQPADYCVYIAISFVAWCQNSFPLPIRGAKRQQHLSRRAISQKTRYPILSGTLPPRVEDTHHTSKNMHYYL